MTKNSTVSPSLPQRCLAVCVPHAGLRDAVFRGSGPREKEGRHQHQRNVIAEGEASSRAFRLDFKVVGIFFFFFLSLVPSRY